jgi:hypothetical protein
VSALDRSFDLADDAGKHRDDAVVVAGASALLLPRSGTTGAWSAPASSGHELLLWE